MGTETVIAHESIIDDLIKKMSAVADSWPQGTAVSIAQARKTEEIVRDAVNQGAVVVSGKLERKGAQLHPTILTNVNDTMRVWREESFGPTVSVVPFSTDSQAIDMANDRDYGLAASVFTKNIARGITVAKQIQSGAVHINSMTVHDEVQLPHGGMKSSGHGRFGVPWGK
jgi:acyl-CoA reductase-like NAD-dependent aldehyde dehydrogenase